MPTTTSKLPLPPYAPISSGDNDELFIAICKDRLHSFIIVGTQNKDGNHILCAGGKYCILKSSGCMIKNTILKLKHSLAFLFHVLPGKLRQEDFYTENEDTLITYKAYTFSEKQYEHFLESLSHCEKKSDYLGAYKKQAGGYSYSPLVTYDLCLGLPDDNTQLEKNKLYIEHKGGLFKYTVIHPSGEIITDSITQGELSCEIDAPLNIDKISPLLPDILKITSKRGHTEKSTTLDRSIGTVSVDNSCRHTAIKLLKCGLDAKFSKKDDISSCFLESLPFTTNIHERKLQGPLWILPVPPRKQDLTPDAYQVLSKIYKQLENIPKHYTKNKTTDKKFQQLKKLYLDLDTRKVYSVEEFFKCIKEWEENNRGLIDTQRGFHLFKTTKTRKTINDLLELENNNKKYQKK